MNKLKFNQGGFSIVETVIVVAVLALVGFIGWRVYDGMQSKQAAETTQTTNETSKQAPEVKNSEDLQKAEDFVNNTDVNKTLDTGDIDSALSQ